MPKKALWIPALKQIVGEAHVVHNPDQLGAYAIDGKRPKAVVVPGTLEEASRVVAYAHQRHLALIPRGNGTKMGMGGIPTGLDLILSSTRLNRITDSDCENLTLSAESGITLRAVQGHLAEVGKGYTLPIDPPFTEQATLGGIVASNSSGPKRLLYGTARDLITGMKTVFPNGDMVVSGGKTVKNVSGYDVCKLLIGSFGSLGLIGEITFKVLPLPEREATLLLSFQGWSEAGRFVREIGRSQLIPSSTEILNGKAWEKAGYPHLPPDRFHCLVAVGLEGVEESVDRQTSDLRDWGRKCGALEAVVLEKENHRACWSAIRDLRQRLTVEYPGLIALKSNFLISKCGEVLADYETISKEFRKECALICHAGSGILYSYILTGRNVRSTLEALVGLIERFTSEAVKREGNLVVESAPLAVKKRVEVWGQPRGDYMLMRRLKEQIDPEGVFSPGRFAGGI